MDHNSGKAKSNELTQFLVHMGFDLDSMGKYAMGFSSWTIYETSKKQIVVIIVVNFHGIIHVISLQGQWSHMGKHR